MSQDPNKFDPKETTEAKLCAYVDGELDAAGRAEIEKYLETNPQHRKLMEELKQTRALMRALPRASAPPEIGEMLQGQLERSLLLNELDAEPAADSMRISRAAQFRAVAAVILLALGLGAVVYFVLPSSNQRVTVVTAPPTDHEFATNTTQIVPETEEASRAIAGVPSEAPGAAPVATRAPVLTTAPVAIASADPFTRRTMDHAKVAGKMSAKFTPLEKKAEVMADASKVDPFRARVQQTLANATQGQSPANYTCVVVSTSDPAAARQRVNTFLVDNKIQWQPVAEPMPQPIQFGASQVAMTSKLNQTQVHLKQSSQYADQSQVQSNVGVVSNGAWQSPGTQVLTNSLPATAPAAGQSYAIQPTSGPVEHESLAVDKSAGVQQQSVQQAERPQMQQQAAPVPTTEDGDIAQAVQRFDLHGIEQAGGQNEQYIVARNMTHEQTAELKDLLSREGGPASVEVFNTSTEDQPVAATQALALRDQAKLGSLNDSGAGFGGGEAAPAPSTQMAKELDRTESLVAGPASAPTTSASTSAALVPATQLLAMQQKLRAATVPAAAIEQFKLQPSTKPTQDVVIVLRNDAGNAQVPEQVRVPAATTAPAQVAAPAQKAAAVPPPAPANAPPATPLTTAPATTQAAP